MYLVLDIGGSQTKLAFSRDGKTFGEPRLFATPVRFDVGMQDIAQGVREVTGESRIAAGCAGIAGPLDREKTKLVRGPHLPDWAGKPLKVELERMLGAPVLIENDTALVGLGEAIAGAGRGAGIVAYLSVSTGVGGVRIVDGKIDRNAFGFEPGHQIIDLAGKECAGCTVAEDAHGSPGHLEEYVSGSAIERHFGMPAATIVNAAVWDELARFLAYGLNNTILHWSPDRVVLGGSMIVKHNGIAVSRVREHLQRILTIFPTLPDIRQAELGDFGGLYGALALLGQKSGRATR